MEEQFQEFAIAGGRIRLLHRIGEGGMGAVFEGFHEELKRPVAVKILVTQTSAEAALLEKRFQDEVRAASSISHPNVVTVLDAGTDDEHGPFIVYELLPGHTLRDELKRDGAKGPERAVCGVGRSLLSALAALHAVGVVHRDVKPDNLFVDSESVYKLGDLGLALFEGRMAKTWTGCLVGTPGYVAPEYLSGDVSDVGPQADIYAAGMVITESILGRLPFENRATMLIVNEQLERDLTPQYLAGLSIPLPLARALAPALARDPGARPQNAGELIAALETAYQQDWTPVTPALDMDELEEEPAADDPAEDLVASGPVEAWIDDAPRFQLLWGLAKGFLLFALVLALITVFLLVSN